MHPEPGQALGQALGLPAPAPPVTPSPAELQATAPLQTSPPPEANSPEDVAAARALMVDDCVRAAAAPARLPVGYPPVAQRAGADQGPQHEYAETGLSSAYLDIPPPCLQSKGQAGLAKPSLPGQAREGGARKAARAGRPLGPSLAGRIAWQLVVRPSLRARRAVARCWGRCGGGGRAEEQEQEEEEEAPQEEGGARAEPPGGAAAREPRLAMAVIPLPPAVQQLLARAAQQQQQAKASPGGAEGAAVQRLLQLLQQRVREQGRLPAGSVLVQLPQQ
jgi:hypothetical protein